MTTFKTAAQNTRSVSRTENGAKTYDTSLNACVDLFFAIGASRGKNITSKFERAFQENPEVASKILLWSRDVRGGAGERQIFRDMLVNLEEHHSEVLGPIMKIVPEIGRWDDLLVLKTNTFRTEAFDMIGAALQSGDGLCAKWMPRKGENAVALRNHMSMSPKQYRKTLVGLTSVVEQKMCAKDWDNINFSHVPSVASARYQSAFHRNADEKYQEYKDALARNDGSAKVNAGAVYPYDVLKPLNSYAGTTNKEVIKAQWEALPLYIGDELVLPMVDVSGSMSSWKVAGNDNLSCMDVAVSLGLYLADKNTGPFSDMFLTFSENSKIEVLGGDIIAKHRQLKRADWGMSTNLESAFAEILRVGKKHNIADEDMPKYLLVLSDMEFNQFSSDRSAPKAAKKLYKDAGYTMPNIVWWNLNSRNDKNVPVKYNTDGAALVSGFSPSIMTSILGAKNFTPEAIMLDTINVPRYDIF
jgi:hypothetical protein